MRLRKVFTEEEELYFKEIYRESDSRKAAQKLLSEYFGVSKRTIRNWAKNLSIDVGIYKDDVLDKAKVKEIKKNISIFSWAQESTPAHKGFIRNIEAYARYHNADIGIIAGRYKNPTSIFKREKEDIWWDQLVLPHLTINRHNVHPYASILADIKIQPTAMNPMTGFEGLEGEVSVVLGHPRVQMKVVAGLEGYRKKEIFTTGACTLENYTDSKAGKKGEFHHMLGFVIMENDGLDVHIRHVTADDKGDFMDLLFEVKDGTVRRNNNIVDLYACGDKHFGETDPLMEATGKAMIETMRPNYVRLDDVFNGHSVSHHEKKDPVKLYERYKNNESVLSIELEKLKDSLEWYSDKNFKVIIPRCNHDIFLDRYVGSQDWKKDIPNAMEYMECAVLLLNGDAPKGLIPYFINKWYPDMITLGSDDSYIVSDWEQSVHGHMGSNGSRGSVIQYRRLSTKMITNHTHSPSRYEGVMTGGTNTYLRVGYNKGASSWAHCDIITHTNGKAQHLVYHNYKCTTLI